MAEQQKYPRVKLPKSTLSWAYLVNPDTKFNELGDFKANATVPGDIGKAFIAEVLQPLLDAALVEAQEEAKSKATGGRKPKEVRVSEFLPWEELENGDIMFKVKRKAKIVKDDGSVQEFRVDLIKPDRKIFTEEEKAALNIGNGTIGIPLVTVVPYNMPTQGVGLTLRLEKMQLLEIKEYSRDSDNEFDDESGEYEVPVVATGAPAGDSEFQDEEAGQGYTV